MWYKIACEETKGTTHQLVNAVVCDGRQARTRGKETTNDEYIIDHEPGFSVRENKDYIKTIYLKMCLEEHGWVIYSMRVVKRNP